MKNYVLVLVFLLFSLGARAQSGTIKVLDGKVIEGQFFFEKQYVFDKYLEGRISLGDGNYYTGLINISTLTQTLRIISEEGDTISINAEKDVNMVSAGRFFFRKVNNLYVQILNSDPGASLGLVRKMFIGQEKLEGAYGGSSEVASVSKINAIENDARFDRLKGTSNVEYIYDELIYLIVKNKLLIPSKRNFEKAFPKQKALIQKYLSENNVRFSKKDDVIPFFNYLVLNK